MGRNGGRELLSRQLFKLSGKSEFDAEFAVFSGDAHVGVVAIAGGEAFADIFEAEATIAHGRGFGIEGIFNGERDAAVGTFGGETNEAAFGKMRDAVGDGVFNERLEKQRRKLDGFRGFLNAFFHLEARAEANFFDGQIAMEEREFVGEREAGFFAEAESHAEKFGKENAHFAGFGGVHAGEGADGVETVEEEMGIDLSAEGFQFGVASENAGFEGAGFGLAGVFESEKDVVQGDGKKIKQKTGAEEKRDLGIEALVEEAKRRERGKRQSQELGGADPEKADARGGEKMRGPKAFAGGFLNGNGFAGVPSGETDELVDEAEGNDESGGVQPAEMTGDGGEVREDGGERRPGEEINDIAIDRCEERMHKNRLVADFHASKDAGSGDDQGFSLGGGRIGVGSAVSFVGIAAEHGDAAGVDGPRSGDANFDAAENAVNVNGGFFAFDVGVAEVQLDAAKNGGAAAAAKVLRIDAAFAAAEDGDGVERLGGGTSRAGNGDGRTQSSPHEKKADGNDEHGPQVGDAFVQDAQHVQLEDGANEDEDEAPDAAGGRKEIADADENQNHGPEAPQGADMEEAEVIEKESQANKGDDDSPSEGGVGRVVKGVVSEAESGDEALATFATIVVHWAS